MKDSWTVTAAKGAAASTEVSDGADDMRRCVSVALAQNSRTQNFHVQSGAVERPRERNHSHRKTEERT